MRLHKMKVVKIMISVACLVSLFVAMALLEDCSGSEGHTSDHLENTRALQKAFPILEADQVTAFRYQDWCKVISYSRGSFANSTEATCVFMVVETPNPFDAEAEIDLDRIWKEVRSTRSGVFIISEIRYNPTGKLIRGEFDCSSGFVRSRYVFDPGYTLPDDLPGERLHTKINAEWYHISED